MTPSRPVGRVVQPQVDASSLGRPRPAESAPRSPNHNAVCERFQGTALQEFHRPAFHRRRFDRLAELDGQFQGWIRRYNTHQRNHGDFMSGRIPETVLNSHR